MAVTTLVDEGVILESKRRDPHARRRAALRRRVAPEHRAPRCRCSCRARRMGATCSRAACSARRRPTSCAPAMRSCTRTRAAASSPRATGRRSPSRSTTGTTPWSGPPSSRGRTGASACSAPRTWAIRSGSRPSPDRRTSSRSCLRSRAPSTGARGSVPEARCGSRIESVGPPRSAPRTHGASVRRSPSSRTCSTRKRASKRCWPAAKCSRSATARWQRWSSRCSSTGRCARTRCWRRSRRGWPTRWRVRIPTIRTSATLDHRAHYRTLDLPGVPRRRLVRHQRQRHDRELRRHVGRRRDRGSEAGAAAHRRPVAALDAADLGRRRRRLRPERGASTSSRSGASGSVTGCRTSRRRCSTSAPIRIFVMGENVWRDEWEWPLARTEWTSWYLHSGGHANTSDGDGVPRPSDGAAPTAHRRHVRLRPARSRAHARRPAARRRRRALAGAFDQREVETRADVLVYTTPPLDQAARDHRARCGSSCGRPRRHPTPTSPRSSSRSTPTAAPSTSATASCAARAFVPTPLAAGAAYRFTIELWEISALDRRGQPPAARDLVEQLPALRAQLQLRQAGRHRHRRRHPDRRSDRLPRHAPPEPHSSLRAAAEGGRSWPERPGAGGAERKSDRFA